MAAELKPCPFCGGEAYADYYDRLFLIGCKSCNYRMAFDGYLSLKPSKVVASPAGADVVEYYHSDAKEKAAEKWNRRAPEIVKVETCFYDKEEIHENCTVQVLTNTKTGDVSVGWWENGN